MTLKKHSQVTKDRISARNKDSWKDPTKRVKQKKHIKAKRLLKDKASDRIESPSPLNIENARKAPVDEIDKLDYKVRKFNFNLFIEYSYKKQKIPCLREILNNLEKQILIEVLFRVNGNQRDAARFLDLKCSTLHEKIKKHNIKISKTKIQKINIEVN